MVRRNGGFIGTDGLDAPDPPTGVTGSVGNESVSVAFTAPTDTGTSAITGFVATTDAGDGATGSSSPITISSLTNGTAYTTRVYAINAFGTSAASEASASFTPVNTRAAFGGGARASAARSNIIDYIDIGTTGNAQDFGDLTVAREFMASGVSSGTRGIFMPGKEGSENTLDYITIASTGNATDFGDVSVARITMGGHSSPTRGVMGGGRPTGADEVNVIDYVTLANTGNASDFGDLVVARRSLDACGSSTRALFCGGTGDGATGNEIDYITIASTGNGTDFGNLLTIGQALNYKLSALSNSTRGIIGGGAGNSARNDIQYVTIASTGNSADFGDLLEVNHDLAAVASPTRGVFAGGGDADGTRPINRIQYITIATLGNAQDFGDLTTTADRMGGISGSHGGLA